MLDSPGNMVHSSIVVASPEASVQLASSKSSPSGIWSVTSIFEAGTVPWFVT